MAKNYIEPADVITLTAPSGGVLSGQGFVVGAIFAVATYDAAQGTEVEGGVTGIWELPKATGALTQGAKVYWDNAAKAVTGTASGNTLIGVAAKAAASGDATVRVRLNGSF